MRKIRLKLLALQFLAICTLTAQRVVVNADGEKIVVYDDGSWRKYHPSDSVYIGQSTPQESGEIDSFGIVQQNAESIRLEELREWINTLVERRKFEKERYQNLQARRLYLHDQYKTAKLNKNPESKEYLERLKAELTQAKQSENLAKKRYKDALKRSKKGLEILHQPKEQQILWYQKELALEQRLQSEKLTAEQASEKPVRAKKHDIDIKKVIPIKNHRRSTDKSPYKDPTLYPPLPQCNLTESIDELTGKKRKDTQREHYFDYSYEKMLPHLKGIPYIQCFVNLTNTMGYTFINMELIISNPNAQRIFGTIEKNALVSFYLLNGQVVTLSNRRTSAGNVDPLKKNTGYFIQLLMDKSVEKQLKNGLVDQIRIVWSKGYEDYEVYNLDFFKHQINCLRGNSSYK